MKIMTPPPNFLLAATEKPKYLQTYRWALAIFHIAVGSTSYESYKEIPDGLTQQVIMKQ